MLFTEEDEAETKFGLGKNFLFVAHFAMKVAFPDPETVPNEIEVCFVLVRAFLVFLA